jgi:hypothetical protein
MNEVLSKLDGDNILFFSMIVGCVLFGIVMVVAVFWHKARESDNATKLKLEMLNRGMSVEEIKAVLDAGPSKPPSLSVSWKKHGDGQ